jgi:coatomer subunit beta
MSEACVILNDIHIDIMDYIKPAHCNEAQVGRICILSCCIRDGMLNCIMNHQFRSMWTEFEWENRVNVNTTMS